MLESSWSIKLEQEPKLTAISVLAKPAFIYQGASNQLLTHSENKSVALPIRKEIIGLQALPQRVILMLTRYSLSCFDVLDNNIVFNL